VRRFELYASLLAVLLETGETGSANVSSYQRF